MPELTADDIFRLHPKIRWAAYSTEQGNVVFCNMRPGVQSYTPNSDDRAFMELGVLMMCEMGDRLSASGAAGKLESVIVNFTHDSVMITDHGKGHLAFSADKADAMKVFEEVRPQLSRLPT